MIKTICMISLCLVSLSPAPFSYAQETPDTVASSDKPGWQVCNQTSFVLRLATATLISGQMTPQGWNRLRPGACNFIDAPIGTPRYIYAESNKAHMGGIREWKGSIPLCAADDDYTADATVDCAMQGFYTREFLQIDPSEPITTLIEPDDYGDKAYIAGIQRLLRDNGYRISRIDGIRGRRTSRTLNRFLRDNSLNRDATDTETIDALVVAALARQDQIGLNVCNQSTRRIWVATAHREDGSWLSRGWWPISVGDCERPFTDSLKNRDPHVYALQEAESPEEGETQAPDLRLKNIAATPSQFCIAEAQFSALGRDYCADRGYVAAAFRPLIAENEGMSVNITDTDFAAPNPVGLRR